MAEEDSDLRPTARRRRWPRVLGGFLLVVAVALAGLWLLRKPLATRYADRFLASKGVPARYTIDNLGFGRQRLRNVVLGDPADPDLVADWLEARTTVGLGGASLTGVRGGHVRLRARLINGRLSFGSIDRLIPRAGDGKPFALPALDLDLADARVRLETPYGVAGLKIAGAGRLDGGFAGQVFVASGPLGQGCGAAGTQAALRVRTTGRGLTGRVPTVRLSGPVALGDAACGGVRITGARAGVAATLGLGDRLTWDARATLATGAVRHPQATAAALGGTVTLAGDARASRGTLAMRATTVAAAPARARSVAVAGELTVDANGIAFGAQRPASVSVVGGQLTEMLLRRVDAVVTGGRGTPVAPLLQALARAGRTAGERFDATVTAGLVAKGGSGDVSVQALALRSRSGARVAWDGSGLYRWGEGAGASVDGRLSITGGGLPTTGARFARTASGGWRGVASVAPYAADGAALALTPVTFVSDRGGLSIRTNATLSGPLGDGRVDAVTLPIDLGMSSGRLQLDPGCVPLGWQRVAISGLVLDRGGLRLCPTGAALVTLDGGKLAGGARIGAARLTGRLGSTPVTVSQAGAVVRLGDRGFTIGGIQARLGQPGRVTRLDIASLQGGVGPQGLGGRFSGAGGQIGAVPLLLSDAAGAWRLERGALSLTGGLTVSDAQTERPRFRPMPMRDVSLALGAGTIDANGVVVAPGASERKIADVKLVHNLKQGAGGAVFTVPGLLFDKALQPEALTPVTFGVIADVRGTVTGEGRIAWNDAGVTSTGVFRTAGTDLAAAFGPVQGIAGEIRFTDLLALKSAPGQQVTVRQVNPGIPVTDGVVRFQTLPDARVQVEGGRWPFAGGTLTLEPSLLDFGAAAQRRMTFRVDGMAADQFLQQFDFKNLNATGVFDGVLPMVFDQSGGRIENGRLVVRAGGGQIAYVGPISQKDIGFWPNLAFQALKSLRYRTLTIGMNGPLAGEMVTAVRFAGISQGEGAKRGGIAGLLVGRLQRLPFVFNIRIAAPFRGLLDATASFYDPKRLVGRALPQLLEEQNKRGRSKAPPVIQPPASETVR